jgi:hypothetical protein
MWNERPQAPRNGTTTWKIIDRTLGAPDTVLYLLPAGYSLTDVPAPGPPDGTVKTAEIPDLSDPGLLSE